MIVETLRVFQHVSVILGDSLNQASVPVSERYYSVSQAAYDLSGGMRQNVPFNIRDLRTKFTIQRLKSITPTSHLLFERFSDVQELGAEPRVRSFEKLFEGSEEEV